MKPFGSFLFGDVANAEMQLNDAGRMVQAQWECLTQRFTNIESDEFIVMPNHFHGILLIMDKANNDARSGDPLWSPATGQARSGDPLWSPATGQARRGDPLWSPATEQAQGTAPTEHDPTVGNIVGAWKSIVTDEYIRGVHELNWEPFYRKLWQRNYWEHIVRDEPELNRIREYIINNRANWESDEHNPKNARQT